MKMRSSTRRFHALPSSRDRGTRVLTSLLVAFVAFAGMWSGGGLVASAQSGGFTPGCSPAIFHNARISWTTTEHLLAAPGAPADVVTAVTAVIEQVYRPNGAMDYAALDRLATPTYREMTGLDCAGVPTPPAATPSAEASPAATPGASYLDQVRQTDDGTVSAFVVLPGHAFGPKPGATPGGGAAMNLDGTPAASTLVYDAVSLVVFVQRDGQWMIDYLSGPLVIFSDVVPNDEQLRKRGATFTVNAIDLSDKGMPAFPPGSTLIASPEASPAG